MEVKEYCTIDELTRIITIPDSLKTIGVMNDRNVNRLYFRVKRKVTDDFDLIGSTIYINFMNANGEKGQYVVSDLKDEGTYVTFSWLINSEVVSHKGEVKFIVCAKHLAGDYLTSEWNTTLANCTVLDGLEPDGTIAITPSEKDVVSQLIQNANNVYLAKEGIKKDVEKNKLDITQNAGEITQLKQDLTKLVIVDKASGNPVVINDSADWKLQDMVVHGESYQEGTPSIDNPAPIINKESVEIVFTDDTNEQRIPLTPPKPLTKFDRLEKRDGIWNWVYQGKSKEVNSKCSFSLPSMVLDNFSTYRINAFFDKKNNNFLSEHYYCYPNKEYNKNPMENKLTSFPNTNQLLITVENSIANSKNQTSLEEWNEWIKMHPFTVVYESANEEVIPLIEEEQKVLNELTMYYPNTTVNTLTQAEVTYIADPKLFIEKQHKNIQSQLYELQSNLITAKISGGGQSNPIVLRDSSNMKFKSLKMYGQSEQLQTRGINLLHGNRVVKGYNIIGFVNNLKPNTQYTYSNSLSDENSAFKLIAYDSVSKTEIGLSIGYIANSRDTFTTPENIGDYNQLYLGGSHKYAGKYCINDNFQVEEGSVATAYEPYTGCKPSPSLEYPQKINSKEISEIRINGDDNKIQNVVLSQPITLHGIPVSKDGNVTIDGQQYISDVLCEKDGVIGIERHCGYIANYIDENVGDTYISTTGELSQGASVLHKLEVPIFEPLPYVDQEAIKNLTSYYPTTNIYVDAYSEIEYIADTKTYIDNKITGISTALMKGV